MRHDNFVSCCDSCFSLFNQDYISRISTSPFLLPFIFPWLQSPVIMGKIFPGAAALRLASLEPTWVFPIGAHYLLCKNSFQVRVSSALRLKTAGKCMTWHALDLTACESNCSKVLNTYLIFFFFWHFIFLSLNNHHSNQKHLWITEVELKILKSRLIAWINKCQSSGEGQKVECCLLFWRAQSLNCTHLSLNCLNSAWKGRNDPQIKSSCTLLIYIYLRKHEIPILLIFKH